ncbi:MAG: hypothetical protein ABWY83_06400, partial [Actinomycetota bacterium]
GRSVARISDVPGRGAALSAYRADPPWNPQSQYYPDPYDAQPDAWAEVIEGTPAAGIPKIRKSEKWSIDLESVDPGASGNLVLRVECPTRHDLYYSVRDLHLAVSAARGRGVRRPYLG